MWLAASRIGAPASASDAHGAQLRPAYTPTGESVPDERHLDLPGYPGGRDTIGNWVNKQFQLDAFRDYYNNRRPHRALNRQTPLAVFNALIKAKPAQQLSPVDHRVRHDKIDSFGKVTLRYLGRLRHIPVGTAHKNRKVRLLVAGPDVRIIT